MGKRCCGRTVTAVVLLLSGLSLFPAAAVPGLPGAGPAIAATLYPNPARPETLWRLVWSDEFNGADGSAPDPNKWAFDLGGGGWGNNELETYTNRLANAQVTGGNLVITLPSGRMRSSPMRGCTKR